MTVLLWWIWSAYSTFGYVWYAILIYNAHAHNVLPWWSHVTGASGIDRVSACKRRGTDWDKALGCKRNLCLGSESIVDGSSSGPGIEASHWADCRSGAEGVRPRYGNNKLMRGVARTFAQLWLVIDIPDTYNNMPIDNEFEFNRLMGNSCQMINLMPLMNYPKKRNTNKYKNNEIERWSRDGGVKKYMNKICRDSHIYYTSLRLLSGIN